MITLLVIMGIVFLLVGGLTEDVNQFAAMIEVTKLVKQGATAGKISITQTRADEGFASYKLSWTLVGSME